MGELVSALSARLVPLFPTLCCEGGKSGAEDTHKGRNTVLLLTGIALGILFNPVTGPDTRKWLKESVLGGSDDFGYESHSGNSGSGSTEND